MDSVRVWVGHRKWVAVVGVAASIALTLSSPAEAARRKSHGGGYSPPYASIVVDTKTGKVLDGQNVDAPRIPASITKVMTLYLLFEQLERGKVRLDTPLEVSAYAASQPPTKLGVRAGSTIEVEDAIMAMVTLSANDVSVVVAENLGGSEEAFARQMTRKARELGMNASSFYNPHGLPHSPPNITTARDLSILGRAIQDRFPKYFAYFQTTSFEYGSRTIRGHNRLLGKVDGVDGIKTGYTRLSGFNLLTSVNTPSRSIVAVVLGGKSAALRDRQMASLIEEQLPRAYAGARTAPAISESAAVAEQPASQPVVVADASATPSVKVDATPEPAAPPPPAKKPLDLNSLRPVVASATGASGTTTPSSTGPAIRWQKGPQPLPQNTQAYAAIDNDDGPTDKEKAALLAKIERATPTATASTQAPVKTAALKVEPPKTPEPKQTARPAVTEWVIQLGATDDEDKAKAMLDAARAKSGRLLAKASPFTEKVSQKGATLYRARFSGFDESGEAEKACKVLKKSGFACFAARSS
ncbi:D-alanyl-D-alanine carboxypeptidase [Microvirga puerhi]|uniref:SPOR domain-containing protein n=1 Tax=Microvirga puerhi TaxID=2876078 RepID=A0ABS7VMU2_9HYPH|nr:D-alanyl-D-alanine carboxypeptidase [Microvirga puerhi]MBZ6076836.1 SPOR domain-containing protein [Microvirga puerhi]